jgi:hypothetical protein
MIEMSPRGKSLLFWFVLVITASLVWWMSAPR